MKEIVLNPWFIGGTFILSIIAAAYLGYVIGCLKGASEGFTAGYMERHHERETDE